MRYGYIRASTEEQTLTVEAQQRACGACDEWFMDLGVSGGAPLEERPGLQKLLAVLDKGDVLVVAKRDRLARDVFQAALTERLVARVGARIESAAGEGNGDDPGQVLMRRIVDSFAEYERALIRARTKAALAVKRSRGEAVGHAPWGFVAVDGQLIVNTKEAMIAELIRLLRERGESIRGIVRDLRDRGVVGRRNRPITKGTVENILRLTKVS